MSIFNLFKSRQKILLDAQRIIDQSLRERGHVAVKQLLKTFEQLLKTGKEEYQVEPTEVYASTTGQIEQMRDRLVQLAFADMGQLKVSVFDLNLEQELRNYAEAGARPFVHSALAGVDETAVRYNLKT
jgi:hypothetical protein